MAVQKKKNRTRSIAGGSKALFMGAQANQGLIHGCVSKRTFCPEHGTLLEKVHAMAECCTEKLVYGGGGGSLRRDEEWQCFAFQDVSSAISHHRGGRRYGRA